MNRPEDAIHRAIWDLWLLTGRKDVQLFHVPNGEKRNAATGARLKAMGVVRGIPDFVAIAPMGQAHFMEVKAGKGRLTPEQSEFKDWCMNTSTPYACVHSFDEGRRALENWGLLRGAA